MGTCADVGSVQCLFNCADPAVRLLNRIQIGCGNHRPCDWNPAAVHACHDMDSGYVWPIGKQCRRSGVFSYLLLALLFISSGFAPTESMPKMVRLFAESQPMTPIIETVRSLLMSGSAGNNALIAALWCVGILIASYIAAMRIYTHKVKEELSINIKEKTADYQSRGMDDEQAFREAVNSMGDLNGLVADMRLLGQNTAKQTVYSSMAARIQNQISNSTAKQSQTNPPAISRPNAGTETSSSSTSESSNTDNNTSNPASNAPTSQADPTRTTILNMMQLAHQGKVVNCDFPAKTTSYQDVEKAWGKADTTDYSAAAKGRYATYASHYVVFGINKGDQIFEVRSLASHQFASVSLAKVKEVLGTPGYDTKSNEQEIIGYTAGQEFKIERVFPQPTTSNPNPSMDHYNVLYPQGTINSMADDPGRQW